MRATSLRAHFHVIALRSNTAPFKKCRNGGMLLAAYCVDCDRPKIWASDLQSLKQMRYCSISVTYNFFSFSKY